MSDLLGKQYEAQKIIKMTENKSENNMKEFTKDTIFSTNSATIILSANSRTIGRILSVSNSISSLLDYNKAQIVDREISILMPKIYSKNHKFYLREYVRTNNEYSPISSIPCFALHRNGCIVPVKVSKQLICNVEVGINFVGNMQLNKDLVGSDIIITTETGKIEGATSELAKIIGLTPRIIAESEIYIQQFSYEMAEISNFPEYEGAKKITMNFPKSITDYLKKQAIQNETLQKRSSNNSTERVDSNFKYRGSFSSSDGRIDELGTSAVVKCNIYNLAYPAFKQIVKVIQLPSLSNLLNANNAKKQKTHAELSRYILNKPIILKALSKFKLLGRKVKEKMKNKGEQHSAGFSNTNSDNPSESPVRNEEAKLVTQERSSQVEKNIITTNNQRTTENFETNEALLESAIYKQK